LTGLEAELHQHVETVYEAGRIFLLDVVARCVDAIEEEILALFIIDVIEEVAGVPGCDYLYTFPRFGTKWIEEYACGFLSVVSPMHLQSEPQRPSTYCSHTQNNVRPFRLNSVGNKSTKPIPLLVFEVPIYFFSKQRIRIKQ
jgi:hypothetical protein